MFTTCDAIEMICSLYECESCDEFVELYNSFVTLHEHGFFSEEFWKFFSMYADPLYFDCELERVLRGPAF